MTSRPATGGSTRRDTSVWRSTSVVFVGNVVSRGLGFLFPVVLAQVLGRSDFALVFFYVNTGFFVGELVLAGFPSALTRQLAASRDQRGADWLVSAAAAGIPLLAASILLSGIVSERANAAAFETSLVIVGLTIDAYYFAVLRGLGRFGLLVTYRIGANLVQIVAVVAASLLGAAAVSAFVAIYAFSYLLPILLIEVSAGPLRSLHPLAGRARRHELRRLAAFAIPALVSGIAYAGLLGLDAFWLRVLAPEALADYAAARTLAMPVTLVSFAVGVVLMPRVAAAADNDRRGLLVRAVLLTVTANAFAVLGYVIASEAVVSFVYPPSFAAAASLAPLVALEIGMLGLYSVLSQWWMGTGRPLRPAVILVASALVASMVHLGLDPVLGGAGAALALLLGATVGTAILGGTTVLDVRGGQAVARPVRAVR